LSACITANIALSAVATLGGAFPAVHVAHESRAATIAPCCAACWMVE